MSWRPSRRVPRSTVNFAPHLCSFVFICGSCFDLTLKPLGCKLNSLIILSDDAEREAAKATLGNPSCESSPYGETFNSDVDGRSLTFLQGGWGKISAAGSAQYAIDRWNPDLIVNLGTCGGFEDVTDGGTIILANRTVVYDILSLMSGDGSSIRHYTTDIDLSWLKEPYPQAVRKTTLVSADRDIASTGHSRTEKIVWSHRG
jgi:adenosylhomocysteine nucleosidase